MKKNIKRKILLVLLMLFVSPLGVYADSISIKCPTEVAVGAEVSCTVKGNASEVITSMSAKISLGSNLTFVSFTPGGSWQGDALDKSIDFYTSQDIKGDFDIGILKVKSSGKGDNSISINSVIFCNDTSEKNVTSATVNLVIGSGNNNVDNNNNNNNNNQDNNALNEDNDSDTSTLSSNSYLVDLIVEGYEINFDKNVYEYTLNVTEDELEVIPEVEDDTAKYTIEGNSNLVDGSVIEVNVVAQDGSNSVYKINITKGTSDGKTANSDENNNQYTIIFIVIIIILVLINIFRIVKSSKKKKMD